MLGVLHLLGAGLMYYLSTVTDPNGNMVTREYDSNSNVVTVTEVDKSDLGLPDEVFVTNSLVEVFPVGRVDQDEYPARERTTRVLGLFQAYRDRLHGD